jgi:CheY-like chemotaxis protein
MDLIKPIEKSFASSLLSDCPLGDIPSERINSLRGALHALFRFPTFAEWKRGLAKLFIEVQWFTGLAQAHRLDALEQLGSCLETYLSDLHDRQSGTHSFNNRTLAQAVDLMITISQAACDTRIRNRPYRALLATDENSSCQEMIQVLERIGIETTLSTTSEMALRLAAEHRFDLVLVNLQIPMSKAVELCGTLRKLPGGENLTVIGIRGPWALENRVRALAAGCNDVLSGPFCTTELRLRALIYALQKRLSCQSVELRMLRCQLPSAVFLD